MRGERKEVVKCRIPRDRLNGRGTPSCWWCSGSGETVGVAFPVPLRGWNVGLASKILFSFSSSLRGVFGNRLVHQHLNHPQTPVVMASALGRTAGASQRKLNESLTQPPRVTRSRRVFSIFPLAFRLDIPVLSTVALKWTRFGILRPLRCTPITVEKTFGRLEDLLYFSFVTINDYRHKTLRSVLSVCESLQYDFNDLTTGASRNTWQY